MSLIILLFFQICRLFCFTQLQHFKRYNQRHISPLKAKYSSIKRYLNWKAMGIMGSKRKNIAYNMKNNKKFNYSFLVAELVYNALYKGNVITSATFEVRQFKSLVKIPSSYAHLFYVLFCPPDCRSYFKSHKHFFLKVSWFFSTFVYFLSIILYDNSSQLNSMVFDSLLMNVVILVINFILNKHNTKLIMIFL